MPDSELDRIVTSLATSVTTLTREVSANREDISKLHEAVKLMNADVERHSQTLRLLEIEAAKEEGRKQASGDLQAKLREHDDAAREVTSITKTLTEQGDVLSKLKQAHDQQRGFLLAVGIVGPVVISLVTAWLAKALGLG